MSSRHSRSAVIAAYWLTVGALIIPYWCIFSICVIIVNGFNEMGLECFEPEGAFYVFPCIKSTGLSSQDFCLKLIEQKKVAVVPGDAFGECGEGYIRVSYAYSINHILLALKRIKEFINELDR